MSSSSRSRSSTTRRRRGSTIEVHDGVHVVVPHLPRAFGANRVDLGPARRARTAARARAHHPLRALVLHAARAALLVAPRAGRCRLRLHRRTIYIQGRRDGAAGARARAAAARRRGVHRRAVALRGPEGAASEHPRRAERRGRRALRRGAPARTGSSRPAIDPASAARVLRGRSTNGWTSRCCRGWPMRVPTGSW